MVIDPKRTPKRCHFADILNCLGIPTLWSHKAFAKLTPEERNRITADNKMWLVCCI